MTAPLQKSSRTVGPSGPGLVLLVDSRYAGPIPAGERAGLLFECAPDADVLATLQQPLQRQDLLGNATQRKDEAAALAATLLAGEPTLRGQQQLRVFEELVIGELLHLCEVRHLHEVLLAAGFTHCSFSRPAAHARSLQRHVELTRSGLQVSAPVTPPQGRRAALARSWARLVQAGFTRDTWAKE
jgi:hypothetical protein